VGALRLSPRRGPRPSRRHPPLSHRGTFACAVLLLCFLSVQRLRTKLLGCGGCVVGQTENGHTSVDSSGLALRNGTTLADVTADFLPCVAGRAPAARCPIGLWQCFEGRRPARRHPCQLASPACQTLHACSAASASLVSNCCALEMVLRGPRQTGGPAGGKRYRRQGGAEPDHGGLAPFRGSPALAGPA